MMLHKIRKGAAIGIIGYALGKLYTIWQDRYTDNSFADTVAEAWRERFSMTVQDYQLQILDLREKLAGWRWFSLLMFSPG